MRQHLIQGCEIGEPCFGLARRQEIPLTREPVHDRLLGSCRRKLAYRDATAVSRKRWVGLIPQLDRVISPMRKWYRNFHPETLLLPIIFLFFLLFGLSVCSLFEIRVLRLLIFVDASFALAASSICRRS
jgi:hypothetical protein